MKTSLLISASLAVLLLSACGGGGNSSSSTGSGSSSGGGGSSSSSSSLSVSGVAIDGYIKGAKACIDLNSNGACDTNEPTAITETGGKFTFSGLTSDSLNYPLLVIASDGAIDEQRGTEFNSTAPLIMSAPAKNPNVVSPFTTMVHLAMKDGKTLDEAKASVAVSLGIDQTMLFKDPIKENNATLKAQGEMLADSIRDNKGKPIASVIADAKTMGEVIKNSDTNASFYANAELGEATVTKLKLNYKIIEPMMNILPVFYYADTVSAGRTVDATKQITNGTVNSYTANAQNMDMTGKFEVAKIQNTDNNISITRPLSDMWMGLYLAGNVLDTVMWYGGSGFISSQYFSAKVSGDSTLTKYIYKISQVTFKSEKLGYDIGVNYNEVADVNRSGSGNTLKTVRSSVFSGSLYQYDNALQKATYITYSGSAVYCGVGAGCSSFSSSDIKIAKGKNGTWAKSTKQGICNVVYEDSAGAKETFNLCTASTVPMQ